MTDFADLAAQAPKHDPASCRREPCGKCADRGQASTPPAVDHDVRPATLQRLVQVEALERHLTTAASDLARMGDKTWRTFADWTRSPDQARDILRGGGLSSAEGDGRSDDQIENARLDRQAAAYHQELATLTRRLTADLNRLHALMLIAHRDNPKAAPDQGCRSCARNGGHYEPVHEGRYRTACRFCGEWRAGHGDWPPLGVVRWRHQNPGKRLPLRIVEAAK